MRRCARGVSAGCAPGGTTSVNARHHGDVTGCAAGVRHRPVLDGRTPHGDRAPARPDPACAPATARSARVRPPAVALAGFPGRRRVRGEDLTTVLGVPGTARCRRGTRTRPPALGRAEPVALPSAFPAPAPGRPPRGRNPVGGPAGPVRGPGFRAPRLRKGEISPRHRRLRKPVPTTTGRHGAPGVSWHTGSARRTARGPPTTGHSGNLRELSAIGALSYDTYARAAAPVSCRGGAPRGPAGTRA